MDFMDGHNYELKTKKLSQHRIALVQFYSFTKITTKCDHARYSINFNAAIALTPKILKKLMFILSMFRKKK
jgi:hypothetical protein